MSLSKTFCIAPFMQLQLSKDDNFSPCPYIANRWQLKDTTIKEKWQSDKLENLRNNLTQGIQDPGCSRCWAEEKANKESLRIRLSKFKGSKNLQEKLFKKIISNKEYLAYPKILTLIPGNECNLACPTCTPHFSSKWNSLTVQKDYLFHKPTKNWNLTESQYQEIVDNSDKVQKIELFGGEPFLNKKNQISLIEKLIEKGTSKNITLYFNTNGTIFNEKLMDNLIKNFKLIEIRLSMDGINKQFEYLRYGASFDEVVENAKKFSNLPNSNFEIICTVSIFNFLYLKIYDDFFQKNNWSVYYNIVSYSDRLMLYNIPEEVKPFVNLPKKFKQVESYIKNRICDYNRWQEFIKYTQNLDKNRDLSFKNTFPELFNLVENYGFGG